MRLAIKAHAGQTDRAGVPHINHVLEVASYGQTDIERITGFLHDIIKDGGYSKFELKEELGYPNRVANAVDILTGGDLHEIFHAGFLTILVKMYECIANNNPDRFIRTIFNCQEDADAAKLDYIKNYKDASELSRLLAESANLKEWVGKDLYIHFPKISDPHFAMNMQKFLKVDFFNYSDYIVTNRSLEYWREYTEYTNFDEFLREMKNEANESLVKIVNEALYENKQEYVYIQVPAYIAAFNFELLRERVFSTYGNDLIIIRHSKYPVKGAYFDMVDVAIYDAGPIKIGGSSNENHGYSKVNITPPWNKFKVDKSKKEKEFDELDLQEKMSEFADGVMKDAKLGL